MLFLSIDTYCRQGRHRSGLSVEQGLEAVNEEEVSLAPEIPPYRVSWHCRFLRPVMVTLTDISA